MLNSFVLCCNFCACKCACNPVCVVPQGGVGDRHLVTIPQGVVGDRLPWGGERQGGGGVLTLDELHQAVAMNLHLNDIFGLGRTLLEEWTGVS